MVLLPSITRKRSAPSLEPTSISTSTTTAEHHLIPRPLRITKRTSTPPIPPQASKQPARNPTPNPYPPSQPLTKPTLAQPTLSPATSDPLTNHTPPDSRNPTPLSPATPTQPRTPTPTCALCTIPLSPYKLYTLPPTAPAITHALRTLYHLPHKNKNNNPHPRTSTPFCKPCFSSLHSRHICWGCGDFIARKEERVGCGWAWWHWGCVRCLLCRCPLAPPLYTGSAMWLDVPPACGYCARELRALALREGVGEEGGGLRGEGVGKEGGGLRGDRVGSDGAGDGVEGGRRGRGVGLEARCRVLPKWMEKLPGNRRGGGDRSKGRGDREGRVGSGSGGGVVGRATRSSSRFG